MRYPKSLHPLELEVAETAQRQARAANKDSPSPGTLLFLKPETSAQVQPTMAQALEEGCKIQAKLKAEAGFG